MPKKTVRKVKTVKKSSSFFQTHKNLKWLLPLLVLIVLASLFLVKHKISDQDTVDRSAIVKEQIKQEIKQKLPFQLDKETPTPTAIQTQTGF
jgi:maltodextrin utilization protein YvdJ